VEKFSGVSMPNHPESLALIRSFLIDFDCLRALRAAICAKFFARTDLRIANSVDMKCNARRAKNFGSMSAHRIRIALQKPLFHRAFLIFSRACAP
jgi:hypothetical protein